MDGDRLVASEPDDTGLSPFGSGDELFLRIVHFDPGGVAGLAEISSQLGCFQQRGRRGRRALVGISQDDVRPGIPGHVQPEVVVVGHFCRQGVVLPVPLAHQNGQPVRRNKLAGQLRRFRGPVFPGRAAEPAAGRGCGRGGAGNCGGRLQVRQGGCPVEPLLLLFQGAKLFPNRLQASLNPWDGAARLLELPGIAGGVLEAREPGLQGNGHLGLTRQKQVRKPHGGPARGQPGSLGQQEVAVFF